MITLSGGRRSPGPLRGLMLGMAAGAAGTTALNAVTYLDMFVRGRPASSTPEATVAALTERTPIDMPGDDESAQNRLSAAGSLLGLVAGVGTGALIGLVRSTGHPSGRWATIAAAVTGGLLAGNAPMTILGVTDPKQWSAPDWISDVVPHAAHGVVTGLILDILE